MSRLRCQSTSEGGIIVSNKPAPRCPGCGKEMELMEIERNTWRYSCEDCGWRSPAVHGPGKEGKDRAYAKAMKRYAESPWISVKDRLPEHENEYLVYLDDGFIATTAWSGGDWELWADAGDVTNWRELPEPPKEGK